MKRLGLTTDNGEVGSSTLPRPTSRFNDYRQGDFKSQRFVLFSRLSRRNRLDIRTRNATGLPCC